MDLNKWIHDKYKIWPGANYTHSVVCGCDRHHLASWFNEWGFKEGVEIGTFEGRYAETLLKSNPNLHLTCIDPWTCYEGYVEHINKQKHMNHSYNKAKRRLAPYNCTLLKEYSAIGAEQFEDESLDFVYIDGNHLLPYVIQDICAWLPKIKKGGVIAGHDYLWKDWMTGIQVVEALDAYTKANRIKQWYVLGRPRKWSDVPARINNINARSWMWVKE